MGNTYCNDAKLVDKINEIFNDDTKRDNFLSIISVLLERDVEELQEADRHRYYCLDSAYFFEGMTENEIITLINFYLMNVADDVDLQTIISFCR